MQISDRPIHDERVGEDLKRLNEFPFDAVLWDMDGTLIDSEPIWIDEEYKLMNSLGVDWTQEDAHHCLGGPMERVDSYMRQRAGNRHQPLELASMLIERMESRISSEIQFTPGAHSLLNSIHSANIPMALVSASTRKIMEAALEGIGRHFFKFTCSSNDVAEPKPSPEGYLNAASVLGVSIERTLIIEDSQPGMTAAMSSGAFVLGIPHLTSLPSGPKVIHRENLLNLDLDSLADLFSEIINT